LITPRIASHIASVNRTAIPSTTPVNDENLVSQGLTLNSIYGNGPIANPNPYVASKNSGEIRTLLRIGKTRPSTNPASLTGDAISENDVPRLKCPFEKTGIPHQDTLLSDPRNDENLVLSQLTVFFSKLHNLLFENDAIQTHKKSNYQRFLLTRKIVALVYRKIIVHDYLELLLHTDVHELFDPDTFKFRDGKPRFAFASDGVTSEFSHAAFRFGHSMVRVSYDINSTIKAQEVEQILARSSRKSPKKLPVEEDWRVDWHKFFQIDENSTPQASHTLGPSYGSQLLETGKNAFHSEDKDASLAYLDLLRSAQFGLRTVSELLQELPAELRNLSPLLDPKDLTKKRKEALSDWLDFTDSQDNAALSDYEVEYFKSDPPLLLFLLIETVNDQKVEYRGKRLGILGSAILGDSIFRVLRETRSEIEGNAEVAHTAGEIFSNGIPKSMGQLIAWYWENRDSNDNVGV